MTKACDLKASAYWLSGACDLGANKQCCIRTSFEGD